MGKVNMTFVGSGRGAKRERRGESEVIGERWINRRNLVVPMTRARL